jgi:hypothetical protein
MAEPTIRSLGERVAPIAAWALALTPYGALVCWLLLRREFSQAAGYIFASGLILAVLARFVRGQRLLLLLHYPLFVSAAVYAVLTLAVRETPGYPFAYLLETTSWEEVRGILGLWQWQKWLWLWAIVMALYALLASSVNATARRSALSVPARRVALGGSTVLLLGIVGNGGPEFVAGALATPLIAPVNFVAGPLAAADETLHGSVKRKRPFGATRMPRDELHVFIIGESARRDSWEVYGYNRRTTPHLSSIRSELFLFGHAYSDANLTMYAVPMLLTGQRPEVFNFHTMHGSVFDLAKEAGYSTTWLVNQDPGPTAVVAIRADVAQVPVIKKFGVSLSDLPPDEVLLPPLDQSLTKGAPQFIGMHLYGSHGPYVDRYPASFARFGKGGSSSTEVDIYDNTVLYTDWMIGQVIDRVRRMHVAATVTYVSDHGEQLMALDGSSGHGRAIYSEREYEIPAFVWASPEYRAAHPAVVAALARNVNEPVHSHEFIYLLGELMSIQWPGFDSVHSMASPNFLPERAQWVLAGAQLTRPVP